MSVTMFFGSPEQPLKEEQASTIIGENCIIFEKQLSELLQVAMPLVKIQNSGQSAKEKLSWFLKDIILSTEGGFSVNKNLPAMHEDFFVSVEARYQHPEVFFKRKNGRKLLRYQSYSGEMHRCILWVDFFRKGNPSEGIWHKKLGSILKSGALHLQSNCINDLSRQVTEGIALALAHENQAQYLANEAA